MFESSIGKSRHSEQRLNVQSVVSEVFDRGIEGISITEIKQFCGKADEIEKSFN